MDYLEFAIKMELDGEKYYLEQAELNKDTALYKVFTLLAQDEKKHADLVRNYANATNYQLSDENAITEFENVFTNEDVFKVENKTMADQMDAYKMALTKEQESIDLYTKLHDEVDDEKGKALFVYLIKQEEYHYKIFDNVIEHLRKAEDWIEDAEFGVRDTY